MVHVAKDVRRSSLSFPDAPKAQFQRSGRLCDAKSYEVAPSDDLVAVPKLMVAEAELILRVANVVFLWENALVNVLKDLPPAGNRLDERPSSHFPAVARNWSGS